MQAHGNVMDLAIMLFTPLPIMASPITFSASSGSRAASVTFNQSGGNLIVTVSNTSTADALVPPPSPDGINLGITTAGDNLLTGNGGIAGQWLIYKTVVFTLGGYHGDPSADIHSVTFQYRTALSDARITVPKPSSFVLASLAVVGLLVVAARRRRNFKG